MSPSKAAQNTSDPDLGSIEVKSGSGGEGTLGNRSAQAPGALVMGAPGLGDHRNRIV